MKHINIIKLFLALLLPLVFMSCSSSDKTEFVAYPKISGGFKVLTDGFYASVNSSAYLVGATEASREWDFGDGTITTASTHTYAQPGGYTVTLLVKDTHGVVYKDTRAVRINPAGATVDFAYSINDKQVTFTNGAKVVSGAVVKYLWDFGDSATSAEKDPIHKYANFGVYPVTLSFKDNYGVTHSMWKEVPVSPFMLTPNFTYSVNAYTVAFEDATISNAGSIKSYLWDFGDGNTSVEQNPSHTFAAGEYSVTLTIVDNADIPHKITKKVYIAKAVVVPDFTYTQHLSTINLANASRVAGGKILAYEWSFGDGSALVNTETASHTYASEGKHVVTLKVTDNYGEIHTVSKTISVGLPFIVADFTYIVTMPDVAVTASATVLNGEITDYAWDFGDGTAEVKGKDASHTYTGMGNFIVKLTVTDNTGAKASVTKPVAISTVKVAPAFEFSVTDTFTVNVTDKTMISGGSITNYEWNFGEGALVNTQNASHTYTSFGKKTITLIVTDNTNVTHTVVEYVVLAKPSVISGFNITRAKGSLTTTFTNTTTPSSAITTYSWDFGDGNTSNVASPIHTYAKAGNYAVKLVMVDVAGDSHTISKNIGISPANTVPDFLFVRVGTTYAVQFTDKTVVLPGSTITARKWTFKPAATSTELNPSFDFVKAGDYDVTLEVTDNHNVTNSITKKVPVVDVSVSADFTIVRDNNNYLVYQFRDSSAVYDGTITKYKWTIDGTAYDNALPIMHYTFARSGVYAVTLEVTDNKGATHSVSKQVSVLAYATAQARFSFTQSAFNKKLVTFKNESLVTQGYKSFEWDFGDGTPVNITDWETVTHIYAGGKEYTAKLTLTDIIGMKSTYQVPIQTSSIKKSIVGGSYSAALTDAGEVYGWGTVAGSASAGREFGLVADPIKMVFPAGTEVTDIAAGTDVIIALTKTGEVYSWGKNTHYLLGNGGDKTSYNIIPSKITFPTAAGAIKSISGSSYAILAIGSDNAIYGWGDTATTKILVYADAASNGRTPAKLTGVTGVVTMVYASGETALALTSDGKMWSWGRGNLPAQPEPFFDGSTDDKRIKQMAVSGDTANGLFDNFIVLTVSGVIHVWGANKDGLVGTGTAADTQVSRTVLNINSGEKAVAIAKGEHTAVVMEYGDVYTWGKNNVGQLGLGNKDDKATPQRVTRIPFDSFIKNTSVVENSFATSVVTSTGEVWTWGGNASYNLGTGDKVDKDVPERVIPAKEDAVPSVTPDIATKVSGLTVSFYDASIRAFEPLVTQEWNFGDGSELVHTDNPVHSYAIAGTYSVTLTLKSAKGNVYSVKRDVTVN